MSEVANQLTKQGYVLESTLRHNELIGFISLYLFKKNNVTLGFLIVNIGLLILWIFTVVNLIFTGSSSFYSILYYIIAGSFGTFLLVIPHEALHGLAYKLSGAKKVAYKANWKKLYFMAAADKFITTKKSFYFIALLPFVCITLMLLIVAYFIPPPYQIIFTTATFIHATMCAGDFGLLSYFDSNREKEIVTFDDLEKGESYFYSRNK